MSYISWDLKARVDQGVCMCMRTVREESSKYLQSEKELIGRPMRVIHLFHPQCSCERLTEETMIVHFLRSVRKYADLNHWLVVAHQRVLKASISKDDKGEITMPCNLSSGPMFILSNGETMSHWIHLKMMKASKSRFWMIYLMMSGWYLLQVHG